MFFKLRSGMITLFIISQIFFMNALFATPREVLQQYFKAVQSHNIQQILPLFATDAVIITAHGKIKGIIDIRQFYQNGILKCTHFQPEPGPFFTWRNEIAVEITLHCDGIDKKIGDFFTIKNNKITSMRVYSGHGYQP